MVVGFAQSVEHLHHGRGVGGEPHDVEQVGHPSFAAPRFMTDFSFMATGAAGRATSTVTGGVSSAARCTGVGVCAAQAWRRT